MESYSMGPLQKTSFMETHPCCCLSRARSLSPAGMCHSLVIHSVLSSFNHTESQNRGASGHARRDHQGHVVYPTPPLHHWHPALGSTEQPPSPCSHTSSDGELISLGDRLFHSRAPGPVPKPLFISAPTHLPRLSSQRSSFLP